MPNVLKSAFESVEHSDAPAVSSQKSVARGKRAAAAAAPAVSSVEKAPIEQPVKKPQNNNNNNHKRTAHKMPRVPAPTPTPQDSSDFNEIKNGNSSQHQHLGAPRPQMQQHQQQMDHFDIAAAAAASYAGGDVFPPVPIDPRWVPQRRYAHNPYAVTAEQQKVWCAPAPAYYPNAGMEQRWREYCFEVFQQHEREMAMLEQMQQQQREREEEEEAFWEQQEMMQNQQQEDHMRVMAQRMYNSNINTNHMPAMMQQQQPQRFSALPPSMMLPAPMSAAMQQQPPLCFDQLPPQEYRDPSLFHHPSFQQQRPMPSMPMPQQMMMFTGGAPYYPPAAAAAHQHQQQQHYSQGYFHHRESDEEEQQMQQQQQQQMQDDDEEQAETSVTATATVATTTTSGDSSVASSNNSRNNDKAGVVTPHPAMPLVWANDNSVCSSENSASKFQRNINKATPGSSSKTATTSSGGAATETGGPASPSSISKSSCDDSMHNNPFDPHGLVRAAYLQQHQMPVSPPQMPQVLPRGRFDDDFARWQAHRVANNGNVYAPPRGHAMDSSANGSFLSSHGSSGNGQFQHQQHYQQLQQPPQLQSKLSAIQAGVGRRNVAPGPQNPPSSASASSTASTSPCIQIANAVAASLHRNFPAAGSSATTSPLLSATAAPALPSAVSSAVPTRSSTPIRQQRRNSIPHDQHKSNNDNSSNNHVTGSPSTPMMQTAPHHPSASRTPGTVAAAVVSPSADNNNNNNLSQSQPRSGEWWKKKETSTSNSNAASERPHHSHPHFYPRTNAPMTDEELLQRRILGQIQRHNNNNNQHGGRGDSGAILRPLSIPAFDAPQMISALDQQAVCYVKFRSHTDSFWHLPTVQLLQVGDWVVVDGDRGVDCGVVVKICAPIQRGRSRELDGMMGAPWSANQRRTLRVLHPEQGCEQAEEQDDDDDERIETESNSQQQHEQTAAAAAAGTTAAPKEFIARPRLGKSVRRKATAEEMHFATGKAAAEADAMLARLRTLSEEVRVFKAMPEQQSFHAQCGDWDWDSMGGDHASHRTELDRMGFSDIEFQVDFGKCTIYFNVQDSSSMGRVVFVHLAQWINKLYRCRVWLHDLQRESPDSGIEERPERSVYFRSSRMFSNNGNHHNNHNNGNNHHGSTYNNNNNNHSGQQHSNSNDNGNNRCGNQSRHSLFPAAAPSYRSLNNNSSSSSGNNNSNHHQQLQQRYQQRRPF